MGHSSSSPFKGIKDAYRCFTRLPSSIPSSLCLAYAGQASWYITGKAFAWIDIGAAEMRRAEPVAREALSWAATIRGYWPMQPGPELVVMKVDEGAVLLARAVDSTPIWQSPACGSEGPEAILGKPDEAIEQFQFALRLSPLDPRTFLAYTGIAFAHFQSGRYEEALEWASNGVRRWPHFVPVAPDDDGRLRHAGRLDEAAQSREQVLRLDPTVTIAEMRRTSLLRPDDTEKVVAAWRRAGMPE